MASNLLFKLKSGSFLNKCPFGEVVEGKSPQDASLTKHLHLHFYYQENVRMVASSTKKTTISLSTWGPRGTAGLVEEWESRIPMPEENQQARRRSSISTRKSSEPTADTQDPKSS